MRRAASAGDETLSLEVSKTVIPRAVAQFIIGRFGSPSSSTTLALCLTSSPASTSAAVVLPLPPFVFAKSTRAIGLTPLAG